jgi:Ser/Thr protein kinase RdoA (MazF antagonist)
VARGLAERACAVGGLAPEEFELIRFGTNAVYRLVGTPWVLRLRRPTADVATIERQVALAAWLDEQGFPANRPRQQGAILSSGLDGAVASFWEWVEANQHAQIGLHEFGTLLHGFHDLTDRYGGAETFPRWNAIAEIEARLSAVSAEGSFLEESELGLLAEWTAETASQLETLDWALPSGVIHGDAHTGNVLATKQGGVLIDLDALAVGPREWDLAPTAVARLRFGGDVAPIAAFSEAYGFDLLAWRGWPALRRLRELYMTTWLLTVASANAEREAEVRRRLHSLRTADDPTLWRAA